MIFQTVGKTTIELEPGEKSKIADVIRLLAELSEKIDEITYSSEENTDVDITYIDRGEQHSKTAEWAIGALAETEAILEFLYGVRSIETFTKNSKEGACGEIFKALKDSEKGK